MSAQEGSSTPVPPVAPAPLTDKTNIAPEVDKDAEIQLLRGLLAKATRGRKGKNGKRQRDDEPSTDASTSNTADTPTAKRTKFSAADEDYHHYGRVIARFLGPFVSISEAVEYGLTVDGALPGDEAAEDVDSARLMDSYNILWRKFPGLHEYLLDLSKDPIKRRAICSEMERGFDSVRSDVVMGKFGSDFRFELEPN
ncbi:hypothetical protein C8J57DRAFT_185392 [Mycena rebaudengoi]|nr:hypothetical protein C8J57DRAFT_185392 [Mycena rebaudengoi]